MTTIAYRDGILAVDTLSAGGWNRRGRFNKAVVHGRTVYAGAGAAESVVVFHEWAKATDAERASGKFVLPDKDGFAGLIVSFGVDPWNPRVLTVEGALKPWPVLMPFVARGSGCDYALGAMSQGADALAAVRIAAEWDLGTGAPIQTYRWGPKSDIMVVDEFGS